MNGAFRIASLHISTVRSICASKRSRMKMPKEGKHVEYDCVLLDLMLPGGNGSTFLRDIRKQRNPVGVIIVSAKELAR